MIAYAKRDLIFYHPINRLYGDPVTIPEGTLLYIYEIRHTPQVTLTEHNKKEMREEGVDFVAIKISPNWWEIVNTKDLDIPRFVGYDLNRI